MKKCIATYVDGRPCRYNAKSNQEYCGIHIKTHGEVIPQFPDLPEFQEQKSSFEKEQEEKRKFEEEQKKREQEHEEEKIKKLEEKRGFLENNKSDFEIEQREKLRQMIESKKYEKLFFVMFPFMLDQVDFEKNKEEGIDVVMKNGRDEIWWKCLKIENAHKSYATTLSSKKKKDGDSYKFTGCKQCVNEAKRKYDKKVVNEIKNTEEIQNSKEVCSDIAIFIRDILIENNNFVSVEYIPFKCKGNIKIQLNNGTTKVVQTKVLSENLDNEGVNITTKTKYPDNMLLVMVNSERTKFGLEFAKNIKTKKLTLGFGKKNAKHKDIMYRDLDSFKKKLIELIPLSCSEEELLNIEPKSNIEQSLNRLKLFCEKNNLTFKLRDRQEQLFQCYINSHRIRLLFTEIPYHANGNTYRMESSYNRGTHEGKGISSPYKETDFDFLIAEVGGIKEETNKHLNNFCIIPVSVLKNNDVLKTNNTDGKRVFYICSPEYAGDHVYRPYWNDLSLISTVNCK